MPREVKVTGVGKRVRTVRKSTMPTNEELENRTRAPGHLGITQGELSARAGIKGGYRVVCDIERGTCQPSFSLMVKLADAMGVKLDDLREQDS